jgi:hypothetical protein
MAAAVFRAVTAALRLDACVIARAQGNTLFAFADFERDPQPPVD